MRLLKQMHLRILEDLAPLEDEPIISKRRFGAFTGSYLEVYLRANDINHLVLTGVSEVALY